MLLKIRALLQERRRVPLTDLALHFGREPEAMRAMLGHWVTKGLVRLAAADTSRCAGCAGCSAGAGGEVYEWIGPEAGFRATI